MAVDEPETEFSSMGSFVEFDIMRCHVQIAEPALNGDEHLVEVPRVPGAGPTPPQPVGVGLPELRAQLPDGFVGTTTRLPAASSRLQNHVDE